MPFETCPIIQLKGIFKKGYHTNFIRNGFELREEINRMFIQMRSTGIVQRQERQFYKKTLKKNYDIKREYKVYTEGVQFSQVKYIVIGYSAAILFALLIGVCENLHYRIKYRRESHQQTAVIDSSHDIPYFSVLDEDILESIING